MTADRINSTQVLQGLYCFSRAFADALDWMMLSQDNMKLERKYAAMLSFLFGTLELLSAYVFESRYIDLKWSETIAQYSGELEKNLLSQDEKEEQTEEEKEDIEHKNDTLKRVFCFMYSILRPVDITADMVVAYAQVKALFKDTKRPLASLTVGEYSGVILYALATNVPFSIFTEVIALWKQCGLLEEDWGILEKEALTKHRTMFIRLWLTFAHLVFRVTGELPLVAQAFRGDSAALLGIGAAVTALNVSTATVAYYFYTTYIISSMKKAERDDTVENPSWSSLAVARVIYYLPFIAALLDGVEAANPVYLFLKSEGTQNNVQELLATIISAFVGGCVALGSYSAYGPGTQAAIAKGLKEEVTPDNHIVATPWMLSVEKHSETVLVKSDAMFAFE